MGEQNRRAVMERLSSKYSLCLYSIFGMLAGVMVALHGSQEILGWPGANAGAPFSSLMAVAGSIEVIGGLMIAFAILRRARTNLHVGLGYGLATVSQHPRTEALMSPREMRRPAHVMTNLPDAYQKLTAVPRVGEDTSLGSLPLVATAGANAANDLLWWMEDPLPSRPRADGAPPPEAEYQIR
jgi:hypothetical protein